jgi:hypothetical protein
MELAHEHQKHDCLHSRRDATTKYTNTQQHTTLHTESQNSGTHLTMVTTPKSKKRKQPAEESSGKKPTKKEAAAAAQKQKREDTKKKKLKKNKQQEGVLEMMGLDSDTPSTFTATATSSAFTPDNPADDTTSPPATQEPTASPAKKDPPQDSQQPTATQQKPPGSSDNQERGLPSTTESLGQSEQQGELEDQEAETGESSEAKPSLPLFRFKDEESVLDFLAPHTFPLGDFTTPLALR